MLDGEEISDELYVKMFVTKLRMDFVYKSPVKQRKDVRESAKRTIEIRKRLSDIEGELA